MRESRMTAEDHAVTAALALPEQAKNKLKSFWDANRKHIISVTAGGDAERIMRVTYSVLYRTPKLITCTPFSLLNGIVLSHQLGLVLGTQEAALVPFGNEATLIIQYQGKIKLALASKLITAVHTDCVIRGEAFVYEVNAQGLKFRHVPNWDNRPEPEESNIIGAYCQLRTAGGAVQTKFCPLSEILGARNRSRGYRYQVQKGATDNPWFTDFGAMSMKTAVHRAMKLAPQDGRMGLSNAIDDQEQGGPAVIAEGLNPVDFSEHDLKEPLLEVGKDAAAEVAGEKLKSYPKAKKVDRLPDPVPLVVGSLVSLNGTEYEVVDTTEGHEWKEAKK